MIAHIGSGPHLLIVTTGDNGEYADVLFLPSKLLLLGGGL